MPIIRYELAPNFILTITRDGDYLFAQATGQGSFEIFPESETDFFAKITDLQITFQIAGNQARAVGLVVHLGPEHCRQATRGSAR
jgi:D-alanyl-D-alanine-carboxypeptidase/D-alanyl-D-alanine-endopeptidase